jgi:hypothetical protein
MAYASLVSRATPGARVQESSAGSAYYLSIPVGGADRYRLAQLDDYAKLPRSRFPLRSPIQVSLAARVSSTSIPGTWGFGLWNDPFGLSLGFGGNPFRLPTLPNAAWFFGASKESYLSFHPERSAAKTTRAPGARAGEGGKQTNSQSAEQALETNRASTADSTKNVPSSAQRGAYNGFLAQVFRAPRFHPSLIPAGLVLPFSRRKSRQYLGKVIDEDGIALSIDVTQWHTYRLDWRGDRVSFEVDEIPVFETDVSPKPPLGLVIWIDNQFAAFTPEGKIGFGVLENPEPAWLEIKNIEVVRDGIPYDQISAE